MTENSKLLLRAWMCLLLLPSDPVGAAADATQPVPPESRPESTVAESTEVSHAVKEFLAKTIGQPREQRLELANAALGNADAIIEKQPMKADYRLLQVAALGAAARASTLGQSLKERYGSRSKLAVKDLLSIAPGEPWALFFAGLWNMEVDRRGGVLGSVLLGGSFENGEKSVAQAMEKLPHEASFHFAYAVVLVSIDAKKHAERARELLETTRKLNESRTDGHALYTVIDAQARRISEELAASRFDEAQALALDLM